MDNNKRAASPSSSRWRSAALRSGWSLATGLLLFGIYSIGRYQLPFDVAMPAFTRPGSNIDVDPRSLITVASIGFGTRLAHAELRDETGLLLAEVTNQTEFHPKVPLEFGRLYSLSVSVERLWLNQRQTREARFATVGLPQLESELRQLLGPDDSITLRFSEPVGRIRPKGPLALEVRPSVDRRVVTLAARREDYQPGERYPIEIEWETRTGVPLPPLLMEVVAAPALTARVPLDGQQGLGVAMPVDIEFSGDITDRREAARSVSAETLDGTRIDGEVLWYGKQRLQFSPRPAWPPLSTIRIRVVPDEHLKTELGGFLRAPVTAEFTTGEEKRIEVILDKQRVDVYEGGRLVRSMPASTGKSKTPTVTGNFYIYARYPKKTMKSQGLKPGQKGYYEVKDVPYAQYFHEGYAFHGAFWHNQFGRPMSHGCVNLATQKRNSRKGIDEDAGWLYQWATLGVPVSVYKTAPLREAASPVVAAQDDADAALSN